jgi:DNA-binding transcriptional LysR family regulator
MTRTIDWESRIGRRLRLRDLHVFFAVVQSGSMAKAAAALGVTQPSVSTAIRNLESALKVRLFDRSPQGVVPTVFGDALRHCGLAVFDDLRQGIKSIEFLSDPDAGEVRIGCPEAMMAGCVPAVIDRVARRHPRVVFHTTEGSVLALRAALRERRIDLVVSRRVPGAPEDDLTSEVLFHDDLLIVTGAQSRWASRRRIELAELLGESWILPIPDSVLGTLFRTYFQSAGVTPPRLSVASNSMILRSRLLATGRYLSVLPRSILHYSGELPEVKILPVVFPGAPITEIVTLKGRTLSPAAELFIRCARDVVKSFVAAPDARGLKGRAS